VKDQPVLADGRVRFRGEAVVGLVGEMHAVLRIPESDVPVRWTPEVAQTEMEDALANVGDPLHARNPDNVLIRGRVVRGDVEQALAAAAHVAECEFTTSCVEHAYIEPEAGFAERVGERIRIFACTQTPYMDREEVARVLGIKDAQVHIVPSAVGGGFGGKLDISIQPLLAVAAWKLNRPVRGATRARSRWRRRPTHPARMRRASGATPTVASSARISPASSTPAPTRPGATRWRTGCRSTRQGRMPCRTSGR
jgi:CO/xanthine dehydrogenase Mo-binding subunit